MLVPPVGSDFYYALRFSSDSSAHLAPLWAWVQTIQAINLQNLDEAIVPVKLKWWHHEIERTFAGNPEHPLTKGLLPIIKEKGYTPSHFQAVIEAQLLSQPHFSTWEALKDFAIQSRLPVLQLYSHGLEHPQPIPNAFCQELSISIFLIEKIAQLGQDLNQSCLILPQSDLDFFEISATQLFNKSCHASQLAPLLLRQSNRARQHYQSALAALPLNARFRQLPLLILGALQYQLLQEIERENFTVLHHSYQLTPLRKCWIAWRLYRTENRRRTHGNRYLKTSPA